MHSRTLEKSVLFTPGNEEVPISSSRRIQVLHKLFPISKYILFILPWRYLVIFIAISVYNSTSSPANQPKSFTGGAPLIFSGVGSNCFPAHKCSAWSSLLAVSWWTGLFGIGNHVAIWFLGKLLYFFLVEKLHIFLILCNVTRSYCSFIYVKNVHEIWKLPQIRERWFSVNSQQKGTHTHIYLLQTRIGYNLYCFTYAASWAEETVLPFELKWLSLQPYSVGVPGWEERAGSLQQSTKAVASRDTGEGSIKCLGLMLGRRNIPLQYQ